MFLYVGGMPMMRGLTIRAGFGLLIAPITFGLLLLIVGILSGNASEGFWALMFSALFGYPIAIITGLPAYLWMVQRGWVGLSAYLFLALVYAVVLSGWLFVRPALSRLESFNYTSLALQSGVVLFGCLITLSAFWVIARPDKIGR
jgi:hypothetical protein